MRKIYLAFTLLLFIACTEDRVFEENSDFDKAIWTIDNATSFDFEIKDKNKYYQVLLNVRHDLDYPYRNLYVYYQLADSTAFNIDKSLVNFKLFSDKEGKPIGSGTSNIITYQQPMIDSLMFPHEGMYNIKLEQYMRTDSLNGVYSAGIKIIEQPVEK